MMDKKGKHSEAPNGYYSINRLSSTSYKQLSAPGMMDKKGKQWGSKWVLQYKQTVIYIL